MLNNPPRNPEPIETADAIDLCYDQRGEKGQIEARLQLVKDAAMAAAEDLRKQQRQDTDQQAAERRAAPSAEPLAAGTGPRSKSPPSSLRYQARPRRCRARKT